MQQYFSKKIKTPLGLLVAVADADFLLLLDFPNSKHFPAHRAAFANVVEQSNTVLEATEDELQAYFAGRLKEFSVPLCCTGTEFQQAVWREIQRIPYGKTVSYSHLAANIGQPKATRATAAACGKNKISIIVPCHRITGINGVLTGYAGGLENKRFLLQLEKEQFRT